MADTILEIEARILGRDGVLPADRTTFQATSTGDWPSIAGRDNFREAHKRRAVTTPGELVHRPLYGGGLALNIEQLNTDTRKAIIKNAIRTNALRDARTGECLVKVTDDGDISGRVFVDLEVTPLRSTEFVERAGFTLEV